MNADDTLIHFPSSQPEPEQRPAAEQGTFDNSTAAKKAAVLAARASRLTVTAAAATAGVDRTSVYVWRKNDPDFARALEEAKDEAIDALKENAYERAMKGNDILTMFIIKAHDPEYNDKVQAARAFAQAQRDNPAFAALDEWRQLIQEQRAALRAQAQVQDATIIEGEVRELPAPAPAATETGTDDVSHDVTRT